MKKQYVLVAALLFSAFASRAQGTELFLSEYTEGAHQSGVSYNGGVSNSTGNERALEIFNPTTSTVNLNAYSIRRYSNGSTVVTEEEKLVRRTGANTLNSAAAFVYANGEATITAITTKANQLAAQPVATAGPNTLVRGGVAYHNGDDALALVRWTSGTAGQGTPVLVDIFGVIGFQPLPAGGGTGTGQWSGTNPADPTVIVNGASVLPLVASANQSLIRRETVSAGTRVNPASATYNIADQWKAYSYAFPPGSTTSDPGAQSYSRLGEHNDYTGPFGVYGPLKVLEKFNNGISVYPNPTSGTATIELKDVKVGSIVVMNNLGQSISAQPRGLGNQTITLDVSKLKAGLYFVQFISADGETKLYKELVIQ